jgi:hypothetical protein
MHATRGEVREAIDKLHHVEALPTHLLRIQWIAEHWLSLSPRKRCDTLLFAPTHANREAITTLIRKGLENEGSLQGMGLQLPTLKAKAIEAVQLRFTAYYNQGDVLRFNQAISQNKIQKGQYYTVGQITKKHRRDNVLPLVGENGKSHLFALKNLPHYKTHLAAFERVLEVYQAGKLSLKAGDRVMWCRNFKRDGIQNGQCATLKSINEQELIFMLANGQEKTFDKSQPALKHLDYGYVLTNYKVQGKDAPFGVGLMESHHQFSATLKNFYVQISRAVHGMTLVTDDTNRLVSAIKNNSDEKKSALELVTREQLNAHLKRFSRQTDWSIKPLSPMKRQQELDARVNSLGVANTIQELHFSKVNAPVEKSARHHNVIIRQAQKIKELE